MSNARDGAVPADSESNVEQMIQDKGLNAPRLTPELIDEQIVAEDYHVYPGTTVTVCCLTLKNGYNVVGESAAASPENFDEEVGRTIARRNARDKIWSLEGYLLKQRLSEGFPQNALEDVVSDKLPPTADDLQSNDFLWLIAKLCHEVNRVYCQSISDHSQPEWDNAPDWQRESAYNGVLMHFENPEATPQDSHVSWMEQKASEGWKYGPNKDPERKEHPCMVPYNQLPPAQQYKDALFATICKTMFGSGDA